MLEALIHRKVIAIQSRYETEGHSPLKIIADDYNPYVLKFPNNTFDSVSIVKEFLCHYLLKCWSVPTPNIAGLTIPSELLKDSPLLTTREKGLIADNICFGSQLISKAIELMHFVVAKNVSAQKRFLNSGDILKIALFDLWVENEDRRPTNNNILLEPSGKKFIINPIDHCFTFSTLNFSELTYSTLNFSCNDSILHSPMVQSFVKLTKRNKAFHDDLKDKFYLCISNSKLHFSEIIENIPENLNFRDEDKTLLSEFLFNEQRNKLVFDEFFYIIDLIKK